MAVKVSKRLRDYIVTERAHILIERRKAQDEVVLKKFRKTSVFRNLSRQDALLEKLYKKQREVQQLFRLSADIALAEHGVDVRRDYNGGDIVTTVRRDYTEDQNTARVAASEVDKLLAKAELSGDSDLSSVIEKFLHS